MSPWKLRQSKVVSNLCDQEQDRGRSSMIKQLKGHQLHTYPENISIYLFIEYDYLWELQTLLPAKCYTPTPLHSSKQTTY